MANSPQAIKRVRQNQKHTLNNASQHSAMRTAIKKTLKALKTDKEAAKNHFKQAIVLIDRLSGKNLIHKNRAARIKSRINKKLKEA